MLTLDEIKRVDKSNMLGHLMRFPEMCEEALSAKIALPAIKPSNLVVAGMGGSGIAGDLLEDWLDLPIPLRVCKDYGLPAWVGERSMVFAISYSGDTEETLACFSEAVEKNARVVAICSGGKLEKLCGEFGMPNLRVPAGLQPRAALPYLFFSAVLALKKLGLLEGREAEIEESFGLLRTMRGEMAPGSEPNPAERIALELKGTMPVIYAPTGFGGVAKRLKNQFNENSKILARVELFPELCHNEIVGLSSAPENHSFIFLREPGESTQMKKRIEFTLGLLKGRKTMVMQARGKGRLARILSLVYLGDFVSFYLAILRGVDPTPVHEIDLLKAA